LTASYLGNFSAVNYAWSNGATSNSSSFISGIDNLIYVDITTNSGCSGSDTLMLSTPPEPLDSFIIFAPCDQNDGQIVVNIVGGLPPFKYSINNGLVFQASNTFANLPIGDYNIIVKDSLDCEYEFDAEITTNSSKPDVNFLMPTYNFLGDTIVMVDISLSSADSITWVFPQPLVIIDSSTSAPVIMAPDTGIFIIQMIYHIGSCAITVEKDLFIINQDTTFGNLVNLSGISHFEIYPNPNDGYFSMNLEFYKKQNCVIKVYDAVGNKYFDKSFIDTDLINSNIDFTNRNPSPGTYILKVVSEFDSAYITFIVN